MSEKSGLTNSLKTDLQKRIKVLRAESNKMGCSQPLLELKEDLLVIVNRIDLIVANLDPGDDWIESLSDEEKEIALETANDYSVEEAQRINRLEMWGDS